MVKYDLGSGAKMAASDDDLDPHLMHFKESLQLDEREWLALENLLIRAWFKRL